MCEHGSTSRCEKYGVKNGSNVKCKFPFTHQGKRWSKCAPRNGKTFCQFSDKRDDWGYCSQTEDQFISNNSTIVVTNNGNSGLK